MYTILSLIGTNISVLSELFLIPERLGKAFAPVKYDMEGNVEVNIKWI